MGAWLPGSPIVLGSIVRKVRSPLPGVCLPTTSSHTRAPPGGSPSPACSMLTLCSMPRPYSDSHTAHPQSLRGLGAASVPTVRIQGWVRTGFLLVPRAMSLDRPCASQGLPGSPPAQWGLLVSTLRDAFRGRTSKYVLSLLSQEAGTHPWECRDERGAGRGIEHSSEGPGSALGSRQSHPPPACLPALWEGCSELIPTLSSRDSDFQGGTPIRFRLRSQGLFGTHVLRSPHSGSWQFSNPGPTSLWNSLPSGGMACVTALSGLD